MKENTNWRMPDFDENEANRCAYILKLYKDFPNDRYDIMKGKLKANTRTTSSLVKKLAILRILLRKPRIVIIKDAEEFVDSLYILSLIHI